MSVILNAPSVFRFTGRVNPLRHLTAGEALGVSAKDVHLEKDAGEGMLGCLLYLGDVCQELHSD